MSARPKTIAELAALVSDGVAIDWEEVESTLSSEGDRRVAARLRALSGIAELQRRADDEVTSMKAAPLGRWGHLEVLEKIGEGVSSQVFRARDCWLDHPVALKLLRGSAETPTTPEVISEAHRMAQVRHPNVVRIHGAEVRDGTVGLWMELIEGETLEAMVLSRGPLSPAETAAAGVDLCRTLAAVHAAGFLHCDLKARNVMRERGGRIVLMDFGVGRPLSGDASLRVAGTPLCMAPEILAGAPASPQSEIYSLGVLLYFLLTGRYPVEGETLDDIRRAHAAKQRQLLADTRPDLPSGLVQVIEKALSAEPADRFQSPGQMESALRTAAGPGELRDRSDRAGRGGTRRMPWIRIAVGMAALLLVAALALFFVARPAPGKAIDSIAVLPLQNTSQDPEIDYLAEGIASSIADSLVQLADLRVIPTSSASRLGNEEDPVELARELGVRALLTGSILVPDGALAIRLELIDTVENRLLWSGQFQSKPDNLPSLQNEIAREVSENLRLRLTSQEERRLSRRLTEDSEAYQLYLKGVYFWKQRTREANPKSIECLEKATARDPEFTAAYVALSYAYLHEALYQGWPEMKPAENRVMRPAQRALELDPNLIDAHLVLGLTRGIFHFDPPAYEGALRRALDLNPHHVNAHYELGMHLMRAGRLDEALAHARLAQELDPLFPEAYRATGDIYYLKGDYLSAAEQYEMSLELSPNLEGHSLGTPVERLGWVYWKLGRIDDAVRSFEAANRVPPLLFVYRALDRRDKVEELSSAIRGDLERLLQQRRPQTWQVAELYAAVGDRDETFRWLNIGYEQGDVYVTNIRLVFLINELRDDPRFAELHRRIWGSDMGSIAAK